VRCGHHAIAFRIKQNAAIAFMSGVPDSVNNAIPNNREIWKRLERDENLKF
jgi:hypothetical protein